MPIIAGPHLTTSALTLSSDGWRHSVDYLVRAAGPKQAIDDVGVPHGTPHPEIGGIFALDFEAKAAEGQPAQWLVTVVYRRVTPGSVGDTPPDPTPSGGTVQVGARVAPATFTRDVNGNQIVTQHTFSDPDRQGLEVQPAEVEGLVPTMVLTVTRQELESPHAVAKTHVRTLNSSSFYGEPAGKWLCTAIEGVSEDGGSTYTVTYEFEFRPDGWDVTVVFVDEKTGRPVDGLTEGIELRTYQLYPYSNWAALNL